MQGDTHAGAEPALSVVIPTYNAADTLAEQLAALTTQGWELPFEIVVVDNRSSDNSGAIAQEWAATDARIRVVPAPDRGGVSYARNVGIEAARSSRIAICDADDIVAPSWLRSMYEALDSYRVATGPLETFRLNPAWLAASRGRNIETSTPRFRGVLPMPHGGNMALHKAVWEDVGGFREDVTGMEDAEFAVRLAVKKYEIGFAPDALVHYRYRTSARDLWRQGSAYGRCAPKVCMMIEEAGLPKPSRFTGWKSWVWLLLNVPRVVARPGRATWLWVASNRIGHLAGSLQHRTCYL